MNNPTQPRSWILGIHRRVARAALALAIMLVPAALAIRSVQAQNYREGVLYSFTDGDGGFPQVAGLALDGRFNLYGTSRTGGAYGQGMVYKVAGGNKTDFYSFTGGVDGATPEAGLVFAEGNLYGTTAGGGAFGVGTVFTLDRSGKETVLYSFTGSGGDGASPECVLVRDAEGNLYGTTTGGGAAGQGTVFKVDATGNETVLYSFTGSGGDGANPYAGLVLDPEGNLYGTTFGGGASGLGTVFKVDTAGIETVLYSFTGTGGDGANPGPGLVRDKQGNLYGTTVSGGHPCGYGPPGCGTVFKVDTGGNETVLHSFTGSGGDGANPYAGLVRDKYGNLYGTTYFGGDVGCYYQSGYPGCGTVFKVDVTGKETLLYTFSFMGAYGSSPWAGLVQDKYGNLYGTTYIGGNIGGHMGAPCWPVGCGTVFGIEMGRATTTTLSSLYGNPSSYGQPVQLIAGVTSSVGAPPDGEPVAFLQGTTVLGTGTLSAGSAWFATQAMPVGTTEITALYGGDPNFASSRSKKFWQVVKKATTTIVLSSSTNPSIYGQPPGVSFTAMLMSNAGWPPEGEPILFMDGTTELGSAPLYSSGTVFSTDPTLPLGSHYIKAVYAGDSNYAGSRSNTVKQVVERNPTTTELVSSLNPSTYGQAVTWTSSVTFAGSFIPIGLPTGRVNFGGLGYPPLSGGVATLTRTRLDAGTYAIAAEYAGDRYFAPSTSSALNQVVNPDSTTTAITSSANPSSQGQTVTFTAKVRSFTGLHATGTVTFNAGTTTLGTVALNGITASISTAALPDGFTNITATYNGAKNFTESSASLTQTVN